MAMYDIWDSIAEKAITEQDKVNLETLDADKAKTESFKGLRAVFDENVTQALHRIQYAYEQGMFGTKIRVETNPEQVAEFLRKRGFKVQLGYDLERRTLWQRLFNKGKQDMLFVSW